MPYSAVYNFYPPSMLPQGKDKYRPDVLGGGPALFFQSISATAVGVATVTPVYIAVQTISATAVGNVTISKLVRKSINATAIGVASIQKKVEKTISATAVGVATVTPVYIASVVINATAVGVASIVTLFIPAAGGGPPPIIQTPIQWASIIWNSIIHKDVGED